MVLQGRARRVAFSVSAFLLLGWAQGRWAMHPYRDNLTADVRAQSLSAEMLPLLLFFSVLVALAALPRRPGWPWQTALSSGIALLGWFWVDLCLYDSRVASWSTYTTAELALEVAWQSWLPLLLATLLYWAGAGLLRWRANNDSRLV